MQDVIAREGDVLVVSYPEVKVPIAQYWTVGVGGLIYTRKLVAGESLREQHEQIMSVLVEMAEEDANAKIEKWSSQTRPPKPSATQPKPVSAQRPADRQVTR